MIDSNTIDSFRWWTGAQPVFFLSRPNRFVIWAQGANSSDPQKFHLPNPGRLWELLFPGAQLLASPGKTGMDAIRAVVRSGEAGTESVVPLDTQASNRLARALVPRLWPGAEGIQREVSLGKHRIDLGFERAIEGGCRERWLVEVKTCSLVERGLGLFPDAASVRAREHMDALGRWLGEPDPTGISHRAAILVILTHGKAQGFGWNYHEDEALAQSWTHNRGKGLELRAISTTAGHDGSVFVHGEVPFHRHATWVEDMGLGTSIHLQEFQQSDGSWLLGMWQKGRNWTGTLPPPPQAQKPIRGSKARIVLKGEAQVQEVRNGIGTLGQLQVGEFLLSKQRWFDRRDFLDQLISLRHR